MKAIILAAGMALRGPLGHFIPGVLLPLGNKPLLEHLLETLARSGFREVVVILHELPYEVERYFGDGQRWGLEIDYRLEQHPDSLSQLRRFALQAEEPFLVLPGNILVDFDLHRLITFHQESSALITIALGSGTAEGQRIRVGARGRVIALPEKNGRKVSSDYVDSGIWVCSPAIGIELSSMGRTLKTLDQGRVLNDLFDKGVVICGYPMMTSGQTIRCENDWLVAQRALLKAEVGRLSPSGKLLKPGVWIGRHTIIHPKAQLVPPVVIGDYARIGAEASIGPETVLGTRVFVDKGATIAHTMVAEGTYIGRWLNLENCLVYRNLLIKAPTGTSLFVPDSFLLDATVVETRVEILRRWGERLGALILLGLSLPLWGPALGLAFIGGSGPLIVSEVQAVADWQSLHKEGRVAWRLVTVHRLRFDPDTWAGKLLQCLGWADLPKLIDAVCGKLALVGVSPLTSEQVGYLQDEWQQLHFRAPTGLTGLWYLNADQEESSLDLDMQLIADSYYVATRNWMEDLRILFRTLRIWGRRLRRSISKPWERKVPALARQFEED